MDFHALPAQANGILSAASSQPVALHTSLLMQPPATAARIETDDISADADDEDDFLETPPLPSDAVKASPAIRRTSSEPTNATRVEEYTSHAILSSTAPAAPLSQRPNQSGSHKAGSKRPANSQEHVFSLQLDGLEILDHQPKRIKLDGSTSPFSTAAPSSFPNTITLPTKRSHNTPAPLRFQQLPLEIISTPHSKRNGAAAAAKKRGSPASAAAAGATSRKKTTPSRKGAAKEVSPARRAPSRSSSFHTAAAVPSSFSHRDSMKNSRTSFTRPPPLLADAPMDVEFDDTAPMDLFDQHKHLEESSYPISIGSSTPPLPENDVLDHDTRGGGTAPNDELVGTVENRETIVMLESLAMFFKGIPCQASLAPKLLVQLHHLRLHLSHAKNLLKSRAADEEEIAALLGSLDASLHFAFGGLLPPSTTARKSSRNKTHTSQQIDQLFSSVVDPLLATHSSQGRSPQVVPDAAMRQLTSDLIVAAAAAASSSPATVVPMEFSHSLPIPAAFSTSKPMPNAAEKPLPHVESMMLDAIVVVV